MRRFTPGPASPKVPASAPMNFPQLTALAEQTVAAARRRLPAEVRAAADQVPVCYEPVPNAGILAEGWEPDILGLFIGHVHGANLDAGTEQALPPQILLFLENIWDYAEADQEIYRDEVRLTYLHELGHYLGWDEDEIAERGLE
jgi:predicted Zn-dependent protease with MMP-like domain